MNYFSFIIACMFLVAGSVKLKTKFCVNCKYFIPDNFGNNAYGKCSLFTYDNNKYLVDGIVRNNDYYLCSTSRTVNDLCGKEATRYKKRYTWKNELDNEDKKIVD